MDKASRFRVFDHTPTEMESKAKACDFTRIATTKSGDAKDEQAAEILLNAPDWKLSLVHIHNGPWESLCRGARAGQAIVRVSTQGFGWVRPQGTHALCLHCLKTTSEITAEDITALKDALVHEDFSASKAKHEDIRGGRIDNRIRHLVSFTEPHRLRALHILMQGVLAVWASDPGGKYRQKAADLLGISSVPPSSARTIARRLTFQRALNVTFEDGDSGKVQSAAAESLKAEIGHEIGCEKGELDSVIAKLVDDICNGRNEEVSAEAVFAAFEPIDTILKR